MAKPRILYITEEITPYLPDSANARLGRDLPVMSQGGGYEVRIFMPRFGSINERRNQLHEVIRLSGMNISIADTDHPLIIKVASMHPSRIQVYFVDNDDYFQRLASDAGPLGTNRADNDERAIFFTRGTMETVRKLQWDVRIVHCMGWMAALSTLYLRRLYDSEPGENKPAIVYTILPGQDPAILDPKIVDKLREEGVADDDMQEIIANPSDPDSMHRLAMRHADAIVFGGDPRQELSEFAASLGKPVMRLDTRADGQAFDADAYKDFYLSLAKK